jgi:hypothetical protein
MSDERKKRSWLTISPAAGAVLLSLYVAGYLLLGPTDGEGLIYRKYPSANIARAYRPLGYLESRIRRRVVLIAAEDEAFVGGPFFGDE